MDVKKLENICASICFRFINHELIYPKKINQMSYMFFYPTDGFYLTQKQYSAVFGAIKKQKSENYFISDIEFSDSFSESENELGQVHREYASFDYASYVKETLLFEYAIYGAGGHWGISVFQDYFAIVCGDDKFIENVKQRYSNTSDIQEFNEFLQSSTITNATLKKKMLALVSKLK